MSAHAADPLGPSPVSRGRPALSGPMRAAGALGCCAIVAGGLAWAMWPRAPRDPSAAGTRTAWNMGAELPDRPARPSSPVVEPIVARVAMPSTAPASLSAPSVVVPAPPAARVMGFWEDASGIQQQAQVQQQAQAARAASPSTGRIGNGTGESDVATPGQGGSEYSQRMQTTRFADTAPRPPRFPVQYTLKKGTTFPCTPSQPISSQLPGPVQCVVDQHVWSMDGTTILLPRGTQVNGSVERGLSNGEQRLFLVWTDALTPRPDLQVIPLDAPAADEMGQVGVPGDVNTHLWARVKAALLLSLVDIGGNVATAAAQSGRNNTNLNFGGLTGQASSLGQQAFGRDLNIPPTLYRGPGQPLTVYINKYINLEHFYRNVSRN